MTSSPSNPSQTRTTSCMCDASAGCAYDIGETHPTAASSVSPSDITNLPLSILPSDVMGSLVGSSIPTILITDTDSVNAPPSTQWHSPAAPSLFTISLSLGAMTITRTGQSTAEETMSPLPMTTRTITCFPQSSSTGTGVITLGNASTTASASAPASSSEQSVAPTKPNALSRLNMLSIGVLVLWGFNCMAAWG
ncbi:hypothetical protein N0V93_001256 [Gnomoniopsis smithogilvyi]|uniref:Uncharacterized protein n=1 Tax=Gnomoniopsis smithogilvyi TaxID=1191159 RepID=A0A9W8Z5K0_9PEZI|nr:hypothetical protein N0V93_001256 [Gnomoniopsis smithogilvyi]